jgi:diguanylate cyclase (GGDEF)-like protein/PAS domain S-box-containing protein
MHKLLAKQLGEATLASGEIDVPVLARLVSSAYAKTEQQQRRRKRSPSAKARKTRKAGKVSRAGKAGPLSSRDREQLVAELKMQNLRLEAALENMSQGVCMFDAEQRLIVCNRRYSEMYGLSPELTRPGTTLREILERRVASGMYPDTADPATYIGETLRKVSARAAYFRTLNLRDGRVIADSHRPMAQGGWVSTHEDITERRRAEASFRLLFDNNPVPMWVYDRETLRFLAVNDAAVAHYGYSREQFVSLTLLDIRPTEDRDRALQFVRSTGEAYITDRAWRHCKADKSEIYVIAYGRALTHEGRNAVLCAIVDVSERQRAEDELRTQNLRFEAAIENMTQGLAMFDGERKLIICNRRYAEVYNLPPELIRPGTTHRRILEHRVAAGAYSGRDPESYIQSRITNADEGKPSTKLLEFPDGRSVIVSHQPMPGGGWVSTHEDITERRRAEARIEHMARHDALTDLPNRVLFREQLEQHLGHLRRGEPLAVLCLDLDHFKAVNDALGHPLGDALLQAAASRIRTCLAETDTVARLGGDEFAILQVEAEQPNSATGLAQRLIGALGQPFDLDGHQVVIGTSIGIALAPFDGRDPDQLLKNADMGLYRAKSDGRGTFRFFEPEMDAKMKVRRALEVDLRKALANGEFELFYQPIVDLQHNELSGFEALLRWRHPERGMVSPAEFIPLAEEIGLITPIGEWVLRKACTDAKLWPEPIGVAVNFSPVQFKSKNLVSTVVSALATSGLPPKRLEIEITETVLIQDNETTLAVLHQLRDLGVRISMDDFGTGYSSLSYLRRFPFDKIKIDRSFIRDLARRDDSRSIVRAVTGLGSSLGMVTTAEGVETEEQLRLLRAEGCTQVQGYLLSPPKPLSEIAELIDKFGGSAKAVA